MGFAISALRPEGGTRICARRGFVAAAPLEERARIAEFRNPSRRLRAALNGPYGRIAAECLGLAAWKYGNRRNERQANEFRAALRVIAHPALQLSKRGSFGHFARKACQHENNFLCFNYLRAHFGQFAQKRARLAANAIPELSARSRRTGFENGPPRGDGATRRPDRWTPISTTPPSARRAPWHSKDRATPAPPRDQPETR